MRLRKFFNNENFPIYGTLAADGEESKEEEGLVYYTFFYESLMWLKSGQKEYTRKIVAVHIKVAYLWQFNCKYKYGIY